MYIRISFLQWIFWRKNFENYWKLYKNCYYIKQFILYIAIYFDISFKVQMIKSPNKWFVNIRELPLKSIGKENIEEQVEPCDQILRSRSRIYIYTACVNDWFTCDGIRSAGLWNVCFAGGKRSLVTLAHSNDNGAAFEHYVPARAFKVRHN